MGDFVYNPSYPVAVHDRDQTPTTARHVDAALANVHDDGRTLREGALVYNPGYPVAVHGPSTKRAFLFRGAKLIPETLYVETGPFIATKWESLYSSVFGTGTNEQLDLVAVQRVDPSFTPIVDDSYRVIGHVGWIDGFEICVPKRVWDGSRFVNIIDALETLRLDEERAEVRSLRDADQSPFSGRPAQPARMSPAPQIWQPEEKRHENRLNDFLKGGGEALIGRKFAGDLRQREYEPYLLPRQIPPGQEMYDFLRDRKRRVSSEFRFLVLVGADGHLQCVLEVEKVEQEDNGTLEMVLEVVDITLTVLLFVDLVTIPVLLFRGALVVAKDAAIRTIRLVLNEARQAALKTAEESIAKWAAEREAKRLAEAAAKDATKAVAKAASKTAEETGEVTEEMVRKAMKDAPLKTQQPKVSLPIIRKHVQLLREGKIPPAIKVDQGIIVDGNHRYIAGRIFGRDPPIQPWAGGRPAWVVAWEDVIIDMTEW